MSDKETNEVQPQTPQEPASDAAPQLSEAEAREQIIRNLAVGTIELETPLAAAGAQVTELKYDFNRLSGRDYIEAMDSDSKSTNAFKITNKQAFELFLRGARSCNKGLDERDLRERMGLMDVMAATRVTLVFFMTKSRGADGRIKNG